MFRVDNLARNVNEMNSNLENLFLLNTIILRCGAAEGMECREGQCECAEGFRPYLDPISNPKTNPSQLCVRDCEKVRA